MPPMREVRASNDTLAIQSFTAVFVGATSGIGLGAIEALLKNTKASKVYIIGRSRSKFASTLLDLQRLNPAAELVFIQAQVSLLTEVSRVCVEISAQETFIDVLWLSQGGLDMSEHSLTSEGLFSNLAIAYYSRIAFMTKLLPLLKRSSNARVVSVLSAGHEGPVNISDLGIQDPLNYDSFWGVQRHCVTMMSLAMAELAEQNSSVAFLHTMPGFVGTAVHDKWAQTMTGLWAPVGFLLTYVVIPLTHLFAINPKTAGEVGLYKMTNHRFVSKNGQNFWRLLEYGEEAGEHGQAILRQYKEDGTQIKIWNHTLSEFRRVLGDA